ncbi:hypothetical protein UF75_1205 [Desulfosporosinus sp. I2]|uniref:head-tail connector protein n=1 Tax=Desulfosporosinus sp. I2 TaxID=1617025 RepID=UPI0005EE29B4|nr:head-tail connector protein [Desulfosporosinus sp. I2]KJR48407.1 hypothetical protein UF75_1205 [Desulfosporosinus sp. I2]
MNLVLTTPPAIEPLEVQEVKDYLRVDDTTEDNFLSAIITASREYCESFQNRAYITQTWQLSFDYWPAYVIELPRGNLQTVNRVTYKSSIGEEVTLQEHVDYHYSTRGILGRLSPVYGKSWLSFVPTSLDAIVIDYTCGYGDLAESVPAKVIQAMKLLIGYWYENREAAVIGSVSRELEFSVTSLLSLERVRNV